MLNAMRTPLLFSSIALWSFAAFCQPAALAPAFDVASVKASQRVVGLDYNNRLSYSPIGFSARNVTLKRLVAEAYDLQLNQVFGPSWLEQNEYDIDARAAGTTTREQMAQMLRSLLVERFNLVEHSEIREMRVYELVIGKSGPKIHPLKDGESSTVQGGLHFHGDMRQFADLLTVQFSIPAVDKTGLEGTFDFNVDIRPELGTDAFTLWQRTLQDQLGLNIESRKENLAVLVVDKAERSPTKN
jgi:uncharacterized protein (TIGR03435 family)